MSIEDQKINRKKNRDDTCYFPQKYFYYTTTMENLS